MDLKLMEEFLNKWKKYFKNADLPFVFYYSNDEAYAENLRPVEGHVCMIGQLGPVTKGKILSFSQETIGCFGGVRYSGFPAPEFPNFKYFLSYGIPGELEGERYKKTPELVEQYVTDMPIVPAEGKYLVFKRWDKLTENDDPQAVVFFAAPDVLSGLFTLANFRTLDPQGVIAPFCSGCGSIISYPLAERSRENPRAVVGMLDVSARPFVKENILSFAAPMKKFLQMMKDMDESFLITGSWDKVRRRIGRAKTGK
ncbi:MAG: hypothetical protein C4520_02185 [Candidatus Abyssobacteria bacterium SURF_5]|uniref:DUF169 domain-containing protein n=1 Tax=Abyssobacteria bacterium (strain SURF_5) TaxID=2093360 RepID=A0A3A4NYY1_ABYX5|nr:MAG: hypothetical protein C4520_02185 [Candidatus Abyssubacteria bacterium SURF_5]